MMPLTPARWTAPSSRRCPARPRCTVARPGSPPTLPRGQPVRRLVRLRAGRCFYADPTTQPKTGRPRRHGAKFVCDDPTTWPEPSAQWSSDDPGYGQVQLQAWGDVDPLWWTPIRLGV